MRGVAGLPALSCCAASNRASGARSSIGIEVGDEGSVDVVAFGGGEAIEGIGEQEADQCEGFEPVERVKLPAHQPAIGGDGGFDEFGGAVPGIGHGLGPWLPARR